MKRIIPPRARVVTMFSRHVMLALVLALPALLAAQATLTGRWQGQTPGGAALVLELTSKGASLTGAMTVGTQKAAIENGTVAKTTFAFSVTLEGGTEAFTGEVAGDDMKLWMDDRGPSSAIRLTRGK